ncbi:MAG: hypothetical protein ACRDDH_20535, partial [Cetobacterium sp.]|uniref:hypothetical protein n=1 Tax=Cetobacterium sp. TaxID=2071632 RepID=UPI003EE6040A
MLTLVQFGIYYGKGRIEEIFVILLGLIICFFYKEKISFKFLLLFCLILTPSIIKIFINNYEYGKFLQQIIIIGGTFLGYNFIFKYYGYRRVFKRYLDITTLFCWIGLIQFIIYFMFKINIVDKLDIFYNYPKLTTISLRFIRVNPFSYESGNFSQTLIPA